MAGYGNYIEDSLYEVPDSESTSLYHRVLWLGAFSGAVSDFRFLSAHPINRESMISQWLSLISRRLGHLGSGPLADFHQPEACFERMQKEIDEGALLTLPKILPAPLSNDARCEPGVMEEQLRSFAFKHFQMEAIPTSGTCVSDQMLSLCVALCGRWGYCLPRLSDLDDWKFLGQIWDQLPPAPGEVKDIGGGNLETKIYADLKYSLETGNDLPKEIFYLKSPWPESDTSDQTRGEVEILKPLARRLADQLDGWRNLSILELGAGDSSKTKILLNELESRKHCCQYWAVDINKKSLDSSVRQLNASYTHVECSGLYGTFNEATELAANIPGKKVIMSLGSTATNFSNDQVITNLQTSFKVAGLVILGQQGPDGTVPHHDVYHTEKFRHFIWSGLLDTGNRILGTTEFNTEEWGMTCETSHKPWQHNFIIHRKGKSFKTFASIKYTESEFSALAELAGAPRPDIYRHPETAMRIYILNPQDRLVGNMNNTPEARRTCRVHRAHWNQPQRREPTMPPVDMVYVRHAEGTSNVSNNQGGLDLTTSAEDEFFQFTKDVKSNKGGQISNGDYLPDGLTSKGISQAARKLPRKLENVYSIDSSFCQRTFQTGKLMAPNFELVGSEFEDGRLVINIDRRLREPTPWPQDMEPLLVREGGHVYASYLEVKGGSGRDAGEVVREAKVDYSSAKWRDDGMGETLQTVDGRMGALENPKTIDEARRHIDNYLKDMYDLSARILKEHVESGRKGTARLVIIGHGGVINLLEKRFYCDYRKDPDGSFQWKGSAALKNMEVRVFRVGQNDDGSFVMREKARDPYYEEVFGDLYRHFESEPGLHYKDPDGTPVDQEGGYREFFDGAMKEVVTVTKSQPKVMRELVGWRGLEGVGGT